MPVTPLFRPDEFFRERPSPSLIPPGIIFVVYVLGFAVFYQSILFGAQDTGLLLLELSEFVLLQFLLSVVAGVLALGVYWVGYTVFFYLVSLVFESQGSFRRLFAYFGWGLLPQLLGLVGFGAVMVGLFPNGIVAAGGDRLFIEAFNARSRVLLRTFQVVSALGALWMVYIWVYALQHGRDLTRREALLAVGIPFALQFIAGAFIQYYYLPDILATLG